MDVDDTAAPQLAVLAALGYRVEVRSDGRATSPGTANGDAYDLPTAYLDGGFLLPGVVIAMTR